ncbi:unnamed protein product [Ixodes persulcatus]
MNATLRTPLKGLHSAKMFSDSLISSSGVPVLEESVSCGDRRVFCSESFCTEENTNRFVHSSVRNHVVGCRFFASDWSDEDGVALLAGSLVYNGSFASTIWCIEREIFRCVLLARTGAQSTTCYASEHKFFYRLSPIDRP